MPSEPRARTACVILAGGQSRRMGGGDKTLLELAGRPILATILDRLRPQVGPLAINANGDPERFEAFGLPVLPDLIDGYVGPLAGIVTALDWAKRNHPDVTHVLTAPADAPFLPDDLAERLGMAIDGGADIACAASGGWTHPPIAIWPVRLLDALRHAVTVEEMRKIDAWTARYRTEQVEWSTTPFDPFFNVNRPEDLDEARRLLDDDTAPEPALHAKITLGVITEQRPSTHPWGADTWHPIRIVTGLTEASPALSLPNGQRVKGGLCLDLFRKETEGYAANLASGKPVVYVVLREAEDGSMVPFHVCACPFEAEAFMVGDDGLVEGAPMPPEIAAWIGAFLARHHHPEPFRKRKQKPKSVSADDQFARLPPVAGRRHEPGQIS